MQKKLLIKISEITSATGGKVLITTWVLLIVTLIVFCVIAFLQYKLLYLFLGLLPTAIFLNISIIISYFVRNNSLQIAKAGWVILCVIAIIFMFILIDPHSEDTREVHLVVFLLSPMLILAFPSFLLSFLVIYPIGFVVFLFPFGFQIFAENYYGFIFINWFVIFVIGYLQWFKLLPILIEKWQARKTITGS